MSFYSDESHTLSIFVRENTCILFDQFLINSLHFTICTILGKELHFNRKSYDFINTSLGNTDSKYIFTHICWYGFPLQAIFIRWTEFWVQCFSESLESVSWYSNYNIIFLELINALCIPVLNHRVTQWCLPIKIHFLYVMWYIFIYLFYNI